jgi:hypothetical protein
MFETMLALCYSFETIYVCTLLGVSYYSCKYIYIYIYIYMSLRMDLVNCD